MKPPFRNTLLFCLSFYFLSSVLLYGQGNSYLNFSVAEGLPSSEVYHVFQDKKGFIWFATDNGVVKFDGGDFEVINSSQGLSDPVVFGLHEDDEGRIWFRTFTGKLSYYLNGKIQKYAYNDSIVRLSGKAILYDIYYDSMEQMWFSAANQITSIDKEGKLKTKTSDNYTVFLQELNPHKDFLSYSGPIHKINTLQIENQKFPIVLSDTSRLSGAIYNIRWNNRKYIAINKDLFEYDGKIKRVFSSVSTIISLSIDRENKLWIGALNNGAQRIEDTSFKNIYTVSELVGKSVSKVLQDNEKGFWMTTLEKGVYYFPNFAINKFNLPPNSKLSSVNAMAGKIITTDYAGRITAYDSHDYRVLWEKEMGLPITTSYISRLNQIWVSTNAETLLLNDRGEILKRNLPSGFVAISSTPTTIYAISSRGIFEFNNNGELLSDKRLNSRFRNIHNSGSEIYMGGKNGLFLFDSSSNLIREINEFTDIKILDITSLTDSVFLISTIGNGFIIYNHKKNEKATYYNITSGFIANNIYSVLKLDAAIWLGTEKGIAIVDVHSLLSGKPKFNFLTQHSGLISDKVNFLTALPGEVWAFSDEGYAQLPLEHLRFINQNPVQYIKEVRINNAPIDIQRPLELNHTQNNIQIKVGFLSFNNQNIFTRFRLSPNEPWVIPGNWTFAINSLTPGDYKFQMEYSTDNLNWVSASTVDLGFRINPPWWGTWYFRFALVFMLLFIGVLVYHSRVSQYKEKNTYLQLIFEQQKKLLSAEIETTERERSRIAKDLHDGIGMDLVSIKLMANQIAKKPEEKDVLEIQMQLQKTIAEIQNIIHGLTPSGLKLFGLSHGLENYISLIGKNHPAHIHLDFKGNEIKDEQVGAVVFRIIQELVTNSIKHSRCETISIKVNVTSSYIQIAYRDNGIGFDLNNIKPGLGLSNIRSRVESLEGNIQVESDAAGTRYSINFPLKQEGSLQQ